MELDSKIEFRNCRDNEFDMKLIYEWSNDKEVRENSFSSSTIKLEEHKRWFESKMRDPNYHILFFLVDSKEVGMVRLSVEKNIATISYLVAKEFRGMGYGKKMLKHLEAYILNNNISTNLYAEVKHSNISSQRIFEGLNYAKSKELNLIKYTKELI